MRKYGIKGCPIAYMDKTHIHISQTTPFGWNDVKFQGLFVPILKRQIIIIMNAGNKEGFIQMNPSSAI
jgi:hypothetical protein